MLAPSPAMAAGDGCVSAKCHASVGQSVVVHRPVRRGNCLSCHSSRFGRRWKGRKGHAKGEMTIPVAGKKLCLRCHASVKKELASAVIHRPLKSIICGFCHVPHSSSRPKLLREHKKVGRKKNFCFLCHKPGPFVHKYRHQPLRKGCRTCHAPHGAEADRLLKTPARKLCAGCHKLPWAKRRFVHGPVAAGMCAACHSPHTADYPKLLKFKENGICLQCHDRRRVFTAHGTVERFSLKCQRCHEVHAANRPYMLKPKGKTP